MSNTPSERHEATTKMQAATLPLRFGWQWIQDGFGLFRLQPMAMLFWSLVTGLLITVSYMIPLLGQMLLIILTPLLTFMTLCACRHIAAGRPMMMKMWLAPLGDVEIRKRLLAVGVAYLTCCLAGGFLATLPFTNSLMSAISVDGTVNQLALAHAIQGPLILFGLIYVVISALFWHAPALIGWHRVRFAQALFFSMVACWRNKWPFLLYGASWVVIFFAMHKFGMFLVESGLAGDVAQLVLTPINIVVAAILYCSFYPVYVSVFGTAHTANN